MKKLLSKLWELLFGRKKDPTPAVELPRSTTPSPSSGSGYGSMAEVTNTVNQHMRDMYEQQAVKSLAAILTRRAAVEQETKLYESTPALPATPALARKKAKKDKRVSRAKRKAAWAKEQASKREQAR